MIPLLSIFCKQWAAQYQELWEQRKLIDDTMLTLKDLITANGGNVPEPGTETMPEPEIAFAQAATTNQEADRPEPEAHTDYDKKGSWAYKIEYILAANAGPPLPVADIATAINKLEPDLDLGKITKAVTMEASKLGLNGRFGIKKKGNKNFYFIPKQLTGEQSTISFQ